MDYLRKRRRKKVSLPFWIIPIKDLVRTERQGDWCKMPYPRHKKGCPNYDHKHGCPPHNKTLEDVFDLDKPLYIVYTDFDLAGHVEMMRKRHPDWSEAQLRNVLYWQNKNRKEALQRVAIALRLLKADKAEMMPEAVGINVYATARRNGLEMEPIRSMKTCRRISVVGWRKRK